MKKKNNIFVKLFRPIGKLIDNILIRPVTKLVLKLRDWINSFVSLFDKMSNNKFPDMSIDEYMRNFNENDIEKSSNLGDFGDDFPTIPM